MVVGFEEVMNGYFQKEGSTHKREFTCTVTSNQCQFFQITCESFTHLLNLVHPLQRARDMHDKRRELLQAQIQTVLKVN